MASKYFNTAVFKAARTGRRGASGAGNVQGPPCSCGMSPCAKVFSVTERASLRLQADMFNLLNHPNFRSPGTDMAAGDFGAISSAGPGRNMQHGLELML